MKKGAYKVVEWTMAVVLLFVNGIIPQIPTLIGLKKSITPLLFVIAVESGGLSRLHLLL